MFSGYTIQYYACPIITHYHPLSPTMTLTVSIMAHYASLWPRQFLLLSTMTHYDPNNFYYGPLWPTMTQKISIVTTVAIMFREKSQINR